MADDPQQLPPTVLTLSEERTVMMKEGMVERRAANAFARLARISQLEHVRRMHQMDTLLLLIPMVPLVSNPIYKSRKRILNAFKDISKHRVEKLRFFGREPRTNFNIPLSFDVAKQLRSRLGSFEKLWSLVAARLDGGGGVAVVSISCRPCLHPTGQLEAGNPASL